MAKTTQKKAPSKTAPKRSRPLKKRPRRRGFAWGRSTNQRLLSLRMCDLGVRIEGTWIMKVVHKLHRELERRGLKVRPHVWVSHDWFSPDGVPGMAVPFYLTHPRLMRLERSLMFEVEGGTREECLKILRHECGHAIQHAFRLQRRRMWQRLFGSSTKQYPDVYSPNPASRRFVQHLRLYYAQSHPDEDFAETFAVWLQPKGVWRRRYRGWPLALRKLQYVDQLMGELRGRTPPVRSRLRLDPLPKIRRTLREHYAEKRLRYSPHARELYDRDLRRLFADGARHTRSQLASSFLRRNRTEVRRMVARWTGEHQFTLDQVLHDMIGRARALRLRAVGSERRLREDFAVLLTVKTMHFLNHRRARISM